MKKELVRMLLPLTVCVACGPMNSRPPTKSNGGTTLVESRPLLNQSKKGEYIVFTSILNSDKTLHLGDNEVQFRFVRATDGSYISDDATVSGECSRPASRIHKPHPLVIKRAEDGSYHTVISVKKAGEWDLSLKITDKQTEDEFDLALAL